MFYEIRTLGAYFSALKALKLDTDQEHQLTPTRDLIVSLVPDFRRRGFTAVEAGALLLASVLNTAVGEGSVDHDRATLYARKAAQWATSRGCSAIVVLSVREMRAPSG